MLILLFGVDPIPTIILTCSYFNIMSFAVDLMQDFTCPVSVFNSDGGLLSICLLYTWSRLRQGDRCVTAGRMASGSLRMNGSLIIFRSYLYWSICICFRFRSWWWSCRTSNGYLGCSNAFVSCWLNEITTFVMWLILVVVLVTFIIWSQNCLLVYGCTHL